MKIYSTKYALTNGIKVHEAENIGNGMVKVKPKDEKSFHYYLHGEGRQWHKTLESAVARAEEMRSRKIQSLEQSLRRLKTISFDVIESVEE